MKRHSLAIVLNEKQMQFIQTQALEMYGTYSHKLSSWIKTLIDKEMEIDRLNKLRLKEIKK